MGIADIDLIILAGGLGTRLRSELPDGLPKAMANITSRPFISHQLDWFYNAGIRNITLALGYGSHTIIEFLRTSQLPPELHIDHVIEDRPLGTGGAIRLSSNKTMSDPVFVCNGDTIAMLDMEAMLKEHIESNSSVTMALAKVDDSSRYGSVALDESGHIRSFLEKSQTHGLGLVNAGVYIVKRQLINTLPKDTTFSWERDCLPDYCDGRLRGTINCERFIDMGTPESYRSSPAFLHSVQDA